VVALGNWACGLMTNTQSIVEPLMKSGLETYERVWHLPLFEEYAEQLKSNVADLKNVGGRPGGASTAGKFLEQFVNKKPWIHLDIAGPSFLKTAHHYIPKGGTGFGSRLLLNFLKSI